MTAPASVAPSSGGALARVRAWVAGHRGQAAAGAGAVGVAAYALYKRHTAAAADSNAGAVDATGTPAVAGLTGSPDTSGTDAGNAVQDQINALADQLNQQLQTPTPPAPKPAPTDVGTGPHKYTISKNDTLASIAQKVYGSAAPWAIRELQIINPAFAGWKPTQSLSYYAGHSIIVPKAHPTFYATSHKLTAAQIAAQRANAEKGLKGK